MEVAYVLNEIEKVNNVLAHYCVRWVKSSIHQEYACFQLNSNYQNCDLSERAQLTSAIV